MHGKWSQSGVSHKGWSCISVDDLVAPDAVCVVAREPTGDVCIDDRKHSHQHQEAVIGAGTRATQTALPTPIEFQIVIENPNGYCNGQNRQSFGGWRLTSFRNGWAMPSFLRRRSMPTPALVRAWPTILSWLVTASASLAAALVFYWLMKDAP